MGRQKGLFVLAGMYTQLPSMYNFYTIYQFTNEVSLEYLNFISGS